MKFDKQQKQWLKANGYWKRVKELRDKAFEIRYETSDFNTCSLIHAFQWDCTSEGYKYWKDINEKLEDLKETTAGKEDYDMICRENKAMAEYLETHCKLSKDEISDICNGAIL